MVQGLDISLFGAEFDLSGSLGLSVSLLQEAVVSLGDFPHQRISTRDHFCILFLCMKKSDNETCKDKTKHNNEREATANYNVSNLDCECGAFPESISLPSDAAMVVPTGVNKRIVYRA